MRPKLLLPRWSPPGPKPLPVAAQIDAGLIAKWLIPSVAGLFAVVGYIVQAAHSSLLGGGMTGDDGASFTAAAADFFYDLPPIAADLLLSCLSLSCSGAGQMPLGGHGLVLAVATLVVSAAWWLPALLRGNLARCAAAVGPALLLLTLAGKFVWLDAPMARIENVVITGNQGNEARPGWQVPAASDLPVDQFINARAQALWRHIACSRDPKLPSVGATVDCSGIAHKDRRLTEGEFAARALACALVVMLAWTVGRRGTRWASVLALLGFASVLSLPHAYGKLLKPTVFEYGHVEVTHSLIEALVASGKVARPTPAIVLAKRGTAVDLLVLRLGRCANNGPDYSVTEVWTLPNSQLLSIREIFRRDVIAWKLNTESKCGDAAPPG